MRPDGTRSGGMQRAPEMRASHLQSNVQSLGMLGPEHERAIREEVADVVRAVESASRVAWLPLELDIQLTAAVERACGRERMKRWARDAIERSAETWLLRPVVVGLSALGLTPPGALKRLQTGWSLMYRTCAAVHYEHADEHGITLVHTDAPDAMIGDLTYLEGIAGAFEGIAEVGGATHVRSTVEIERDRCVVFYRIDWAR